MSAFLKIKKRKNFVRAAQIGEKVVTTSVILQAAQSLSETPIAPKFGFTTTKKIGKAHIRNRARRRMRAVIREVLSEGKQNTEYVLIGRRNTADCDFKILQRDIIYGLKKLNKLLYAQEDEKTSNNSPDMVG
ncbi:MAG: ribonuclease P protein component [Alphaproteobacteria bacterium]|nr:ribonuclease P protein component [Alphaproteobacteria bacterium]